MTIGVKFDKQILTTPGPGEYQHERADSLTKSTKRANNFSDSPARSSPKLDANGGPGAYELNHLNFGSNLGPKTIGSKQYTKVA